MGKDSTDGWSLKHHTETCPQLKQNAVGGDWSSDNDWHLLQAEPNICCPVPERDREWRGKWSLSLGYERSLAGSALLVKELCRNLQRDRANDHSTKIFVVVQRP